MTKTTSLSWRLSKLPTVEELLQLVKDKIITQEEAKEILFKNDTKEDRDKKDLETEIEFLRNLIEKLSNNNRAVIQPYIHYYQPTYTSNPWYKVYATWADTGNYVSANGNGVATNCSFTKLLTF